MIAACVGYVFGEEKKPIIIGHEQILYSEILDEDRLLNIYLPRSYDKGDNRYPVLYLLDGPNHFHHTTGIIKFLAGNSIIPEMIVVAVGNTNRTRDLTPSAGDSGGKKVGGGGDAFLQFLGDELAPWVERNYRTRPHRILVGHSFGGLFSVHALITRPDLYQGIIAISPSMQWDDQHTAREVEVWLASEPEVHAGIYITVGNEGGGLLGGSLKMSGLFSEKAPPNLRWKFTHMPSETHGSVPHRSTYDGLEFLFEGWKLGNLLETYDDGGWEAIESYYARTRPQFGFEKDVPLSAANGLIRGLVSDNRAEEALAFVEEKDPTDFNFDFRMYRYLGRALGNHGYLDGQKRCYLMWLERYPDHAEVRKLLSEMGVELPAVQ